MLVVVDHGLEVGADELLGGAVADGNARREEVDELCAVGLVAVEEVEALGHGGHGGGLSVGAVLEDELLEKEEGLLVGNVLAHLGDGVPRVFREGTLAVGALLVGDAELHDHALLEAHAEVRVLLQRELDLDALRVRLRPHEPSVDEGRAVRAAEAGNLLEEDGKQLRGLELGVLERGPVPAVALAALLHRQGARDALGDVHLGAQARHAHVGRVGRDVHAAKTAQTAG